MFMMKWFLKASSRLFSSTSIIITVFFRFWTWSCVSSGGEYYNVHSPISAHNHCHHVLRRQSITKTFYSDCQHLRYLCFGPQYNSWLGVLSAPFHNALDFIFRVVSAKDSASIYARRSSQSPIVSGTVTSCSSVHAVRADWAVYAVAGAALSAVHRSLRAVMGACAAVTVCAVGAACTGVWWRAVVKVTGEQGSSMLWEVTEIIRAL